MLRFELQLYLWQYVHSDPTIDKYHRENAGWDKKQRMSGN